MCSDVLKRAPPPIDAPIALQLKHVLAACRIEAMQVVVERGWVQHIYMLKSRGPDPLNVVGPALQIHSTCAGPRSL